VKIDIRRNPSGNWTYSTELMCVLARTPGLHLSIDADRVDTPIASAGTLYRSAHVLVLASATRGSWQHAISIAGQPLDAPQIPDAITCPRRLIRANSRPRKPAQPLDDRARARDKSPTVSR
jgi:hypothetical protein